MIFINLKCVVKMPKTSLTLFTQHFNPRRLFPWAVTPGLQKPTVSVKKLKKPVRQAKLRRALHVSVFTTVSVLHLICSQNMSTRVLLCLLCITLQPWGFNRHFTQSLELYYIVLSQYSHQNQEANLINDELLSVGEDSIMFQLHLHGGPVWITLVFTRKNCSTPCR